MRYQPRASEDRVEMGHRLGLEGGQGVAVAIAVRP